MHNATIAPESRLPRFGILIVLAGAIILSGCQGGPLAGGGGETGCPNQDESEAARERMFAQPEPADIAKAEVTDPAFGRKVVTGYVRDNRIYLPG